MKVEEFRVIMQTDYADDPMVSYDGCKVLKGLNLIAKYLPTSGVEGVNNDILYACSQEVLADDITEEDAITLRKWGWFIDGVYLASFV